MILTHVCLTRWGLKRFENKVNEISKTKNLLDLRIEELGFFRILCVARFG
jgi:hypothetical protein